MTENTVNEIERMVVTRVFDAPRELVWKAWTDPKYVMQWWGPKGFTAPVCEMDFRVGGKFLCCMKSPDGQEFWNAVEYHEIRSEEHTSELQSRQYLVCRLLLEKKKKHCKAEVGGAWEGTVCQGRWGVTGRQANDRLVLEETWRLKQCTPNIQFWKLETVTELRD